MANGEDSMFQAIIPPPVFRLNLSMILAWWR